ncbi:hypothetical protein SLEP1_g25763 [Rubroshorea leprosula]|uniref:Bifunctional inhibitor/plant lipid transfer protein/seed storage helical domain-containing protein n=1 Tax=Rubroshorea leprosula TaxID=152421 RepID=A0AAV5JXH8_9ROSI|nr:hypothetical protein SLEP1_g25763 [Rubroshorea leprosula]
MAFSRYLLVLAMVVFVATSNHHQAHAYTCVNVQADLSLTCDGYLGGVLGLANSLLGGLPLINTLPLVGGLVQGLLPAGQCCADVKNMYNQCTTAQVDLQACLQVCNLSLVNLCLILKTCGVSATICVGYV